ncbi:MAG: hypothetical protein P8J33_04670 [Pirellulaceae bacterium]|nr:hypothetical protein [Pirellulaceae bacterium]
MIDDNTILRIDGSEFTKPRRSMRRGFVDGAPPVRVKRFETASLPPVTAARMIRPEQAFVVSPISERPVE